jgi:3D (Asp-Asp-Asp) domain-containing protein
MLYAKTAVVVAATLGTFVAPEPAKADTVQAHTTTIPGPVVTKTKKYRVRVPIEHYSLRATAYSTEGCDASGGGGMTSMGTTPYFGEVANNFLPLGTKIYFPKAIYGRHEFRVEDHIGWGSQLDIWVHCGYQMNNWNNPTVHFYTYKWKTKTKKVRVRLSYNVIKDPLRPVVIGSKAILYNNVAYAPSEAPNNVKAVIWAGNKINTLPYTWGGGHGSFEASGYDCSGSVSYALHGANLLSTPMDSGSLMSWGRSGAGKWITVYANSGHAFMFVAGLRFDTSGANPSRWQNGAGYGDSYTLRHPVNL